ncbi:MAG: dihydroorotase [Crocinitomicaceae bacterium]
MKLTVIKNATIINENSKFVSDLLIKEGRIEKIDNNISIDSNHEVIDAEGLFLLPGCIDDQVHFREPGLTHKANIFTESRAAVAGGITSFMEMPNTVPSAVTIEELKKKYATAQKTSLANYSFYLGTTNSNIEEIKRINPLEICGVKIFMGSSTGDMLVDDPQALEDVFHYSPTIITTHCEDDPMIKQNFQKYLAEFGETLPAKFHPLIRSEEACYKSSSFAISLAKKYNSRLHILHISTEKELELFTNQIPLKEKRITAEACIHHLWFSEEDYEQLGNLIKWNPAVKKASDRDAIMKAVKENVIDVIATDHAPHTFEEKSQMYSKAPSGGPLVQYALLAMLEKVKEGKISIEKVVEKMCHAPAELFQVSQRGFIREGYFADLVLVNPSRSITVSKEQILSKCKWSPFEGYTFSNSIDTTFVNGEVVYKQGKLIDNSSGCRLSFDR